LIGSLLVDSLVRMGHDVFGVDALSSGKLSNLNAKAIFTLGDIRQNSLMTQLMAGMDGCFHLAAIASVQKCTEEWIDTHTVNLTGTISIFDAARQVGDIPVVYASSAAVYGDGGAEAQSECQQVNPLSAYGADKYSCELQARVASVIHQVPSAGFRFFNVYGPRQDPKSPYSGVLSIFVDRISRGEPVRIFGTGQQSRDFIHVYDVVRHLIAGMDHVSRHGTSDVFNACTGKSTSVVELARSIAAAFGSEAEIRYEAARAGDIAASLGNPTKSKSTLGLVADIGLNAGIRTLIEHPFLENGAATVPALQTSPMRGALTSPQLEQTA